MGVGAAKPVRRLVCASRLGSYSEQCVQRPGPGYFLRRRDAVFRVRSTWRLRRHRHLHDDSHETASPPVKCRTPHIRVPQGSKRVTPLTIPVLLVAIGGGAASRAAAQADDVGDERVVRVMTRNVYHGVDAEIFDVPNGASTTDLLAKVTAVYRRYLCATFPSVPRRSPPRSMASDLISSAYRKQSSCVRSHRQTARPPPLQRSPLTACSCSSTRSRHAGWRSRSSCTRSGAHCRRRTRRPDAIGVMALGSRRLRGGARRANPFTVN